MNATAFAPPPVCRGATPPALELELAAPAAVDEAAALELPDADALLVMAGAGADEDDGNGEKPTTVPPTLTAEVAVTTSTPPISCPPPLSVL